MSAPLSAEQGKYKVLNSEDLSTYQPQISTVHSHNTTQKVDLVVLSRNERSAENIARALAKKQAEGQRILWYGGSKYHELKKNKFVAQSNKFKTDKAVYIHDVMHDENNGLHELFSKAPVVPVTGYFLDADSSREVRISHAAPYVLLNLKDGTQHYAPMLYLDLVNFDFDWAKISSESSKLGDLGNLDQPTRPSFSIPATKTKGKNNKVQGKNSKASASDSSSSSSPSAPSTPPTAQHDQTMSAEHINELYTIATTQRPSWWLIITALLVALIIMIGPTCNSSLVTHDSITALLKNNGQGVPTPQVTQVTLSNTTEVLHQLEEKEVIVYEDFKTVIRRFLLLLGDSVSYIFKDIPAQVYRKVKSSLEHKPQNTIVPRASSSSVRQKFAETYIQGAVEVL